MPPLSPPSPPPSHTHTWTECRGRLKPKHFEKVTSSLTDWTLIYLPLSADRFDRYQSSKVTISVMAPMNSNDQSSRLTRSPDTAWDRTDRGRPWRMPLQFDEIIDERDWIEKIHLIFGVHFFSCTIDIIMQISCKWAADWDVTALPLLSLS